MRFQYFYEKDDDSDWRSKRVYHLTPVTRKRTRVMIKSLPPEEQEKYRPGAKPVEPVEVIPSGHLLTFFLVVDDPDHMKNLEPERLTKSTDDSAKAIEFGNEGKYIIKAIGVPVMAVKSYQDDKGEWYDFEDDMTDEEKEEFIKFEEHQMFLLDLYKWQKVITFSDAADGEIKEEGARYIDRLILENEVAPLDNKFVMKLTNHLEKMFPSYGELDNGINIELRNVMKVGDGKEVKKVKQRIHDILQRAKTKLLRDVQNKVEKLKATRKDNQQMTQPSTTDKTIPDQSVPQDVNSKEI